MEKNSVANVDNEQSSVENSAVELSADTNGGHSKLSSFAFSLKQTFKRFASPKFSAAYLSKLAILTAISFILYAFGKFNLPFMFPSFLEMQISELPALLAGFSMGPVSGCLVIIFKCLLKFPMTSTAYVGEATDMLLGIAFTLPASLIYHMRKDKVGQKSGIVHALIGLSVGSVLMAAAAILVNRYISIPFYTQLYFGGNFEIILSVVRPIYKSVTVDNFYAYYLLLGVLPFNLLRCIIVSLIAFILYKRLSVILHWEGTSLLKKKKGAVEQSSENKLDESIIGTHAVKGVDETYALAQLLADELDGGEVLLLNGELGAGKTTFTKGLALALGVTDEVTSPTFTILNVYENGRLKLNHLDMYRIESEDEVAELGLDDCFDKDSVTVIEWNKFEHIDSEIYTVDIKYIDEDEREITIAVRSE